MWRYKNAYYKIFIRTCDILEDIEKLTADKNISDKTRAKLRKIADNIKKAHIEAEEYIIKDNVLVKYVQNIYNKL